MFSLFYVFYRLSFLFLCFSLKSFGFRVRMVDEPSLVLQERHMTEFPETRASLLLEVRSPESQTAWEEFVQLYRPAIYRMARKRQLQDADAQDITQNVLLKIAGAIGNYEPREGVRFRHWLRGRVVSPRPA